MEHYVATLAAGVVSCFGSQSWYFIYVKLYTPGGQGRSCSTGRGAMRKGIHIAFTIPSAIEMFSLPTQDTGDSMVGSSDDRP